MPVFEYRCPRCGHVFDHWWRGQERREELSCPECGASDVEKLISRFGTKRTSSGTSAYSGASCAPSG